MMKLQTLSSFLGLSAPAFLSAYALGSGDVSAPVVHPFHALARDVRLAKLQGRDNELKNTTSIAKSWNGATLYSLSEEVADTGITAGISVTCTTCYVTGSVTAELSYSEDLDLGETVKNFTLDAIDDVKDVTHQVLDYFENQVDGFWTNVTDDIAQLDFDFDDIDFPPINVSLNLDFPDISECDLRFELDGLEIYLELDTVLSAASSYTLNLYTSDSPIGFAVSDDNYVGVVVAVDLILSSDANIDISTGVHFKANDGLAFDLSLFGQNVTGIDNPGSSFEFLPLTVSGAGTLTAVLRVALQAGIDLDIDITLNDINGGAQVKVYADLAEFTTNVTASIDADDNDGCNLHVEEYYTFALGAAAGATLAIGNETWGPDYETKTPIFYTTLADKCITAASSSSIPISTVSVEARADLTTTTLVHEVIMTGMSCASTGLIACPASLRSTSKVTKTETLITSVESGSKATWPATTATTVSAIDFSDNKKEIESSSGDPKSYVPPPKTTSTASGQDHSGTASPSDTPMSQGVFNERLIIGLSVGLGVPVLAGFLAAAFVLFRRQRYVAVPHTNGEGGAKLVSPNYDESMDYQYKKPAVSVIEAEDWARDGRRQS
ncbi:hypothetical protein F5Y18DRAFT_338253 [Xylariaceae sp. FL1019]|nr:hypothetical protein F5Y18DRAFT_338253 [Xylariaceae sp. FL1019]